MGPLKHLVVRPRKSLLNTVSLLPPNKTHKGITVKCAERKWAHSFGRPPALPFASGTQLHLQSLDLEGSSTGRLVSGLAARWLGSNPDSSVYYKASGLIRSLRSPCLSRVTCKMGTIFTRYFVLLKREACGPAQDEDGQRCFVPQVGGICEPQCTCGGQRAACRNQFSPSVIRVLGLNSGRRGLVASSFTP